ncbi:MAG TPA: S8 family serine peptidase [Solirubrobacter sp.]|nr:S8 family serine peptidase [Solirubrobacter sp.]
MTRPRLGLACALALLWTLGCALPAAAAAPVLNEPYYQWALQSSDLHGVDVENAWGVATGEGVLVGVVDTPIDASHEDLHRNVDTQDPYPAVGRPCSGPPSTHGNLVAGIIAAERNNGKGIAGVAPDAEILPVPALDACGGGTRESVLDGMRYAAGEREARVVVASFATDPLMSPEQRAGIEADFSALFAAYPDTLFVVAAGNEGADVDELPVYPCSTGAAVDGARPANLVCVAMTNENELPACSSNVGRRSVDLFAQGVQIRSTTTAPGGYGLASGTSMAAAMVAGAAALLASKPLAEGDEPLTGAQLKDKLLKGTDRYGNWEGWSASRGRLNAYKPLELGDNDLPVGSEPLGLDWTSCDDDHDGFTNLGDDCRDTPGPVVGCPDADGDGVADGDDNCAATRNPGQGDADRDGRGDACDPTPRGGDADGDGRADLDDRCPSEYATTTDGCPAAVIIQPPSGPPPPPPPPPVVNPPVVTPPPIVPIAEPRITKVSVKVRPRHCKRGRKCRKAARVTVRVSTTATVTVRVERRVGRRGHRRWKRVLRRTLAATERGSRLTVRGKHRRSLARGKYRVRVTLPGGSRETRRFKV